MVSAVQGKKSEDKELPPLSRFSPQRFSFVRLSSASDKWSEGDPPEAFSLDSAASSESQPLLSHVRIAKKLELPKTAARDVAFTRLRPSKSNELLGRVRQFVTNKNPRVDAMDKPPASDDSARSHKVADSTDNLENSKLQPTTDTLLRLFKEGHGLPEIKQICGFEESVDDLQVRWWRAVVSQ